DPGDTYAVVADHERTDAPPCQLLCCLAEPRRGPDRRDVRALACEDDRHRNRHRPPPSLVTRGSCHPGVGEGRADRTAVYRAPRRWATSELVDRSNSRRGATERDDVGLPSAGTPPAWLLSLEGPVTRVVLDGVRPEGGLELTEQARTAFHPQIVGEPV